MYDDELIEDEYSDEVWDYIVLTLLGVYYEPV